jgi:hypothetical protein
MSDSALLNASYTFQKLSPQHNSYNRQMPCRISPFLSLFDFLFFLNLLISAIVEHFYSYPIAAAFPFSVSQSELWSLFGGSRPPFPENITQSHF